MSETMRRCEHAILTERSKGQLQLLDSPWPDLRSGDTLTLFPQGGIMRFMAIIAQHIVDLRVLVWLKTLCSAPFAPYCMLKTKANGGFLRPLVQWRGPMMRAVGRRATVMKQLLLYVLCMVCRP